jgi:DNA-binding phage protein
MGARLHRGDPEAWAHVLGAVAAARGNLAAAARDGGLDERSLRRWVSAHPRLRRAVDATRELHRLRSELSGELFGWTPA